MADKFYRDFCSSRDNQDNSERGSSSEEVDIPQVMTEEVMKALKKMQPKKAPGEDQITDLIQDSGQIIPENLASLYTQSLMTASIKKSWKNANIIRIHKKSATKDSKN